MGLGFRFWVQASTTERDLAALIQLPFAALAITDCVYSQATIEIVVLDSLHSYSIGQLK